MLENSLVCDTRGFILNFVYTFVNLHVPCSLASPTLRKYTNLKDTSNVPTVNINLGVLVSSLWMNLCIYLFGTGSVRLQCS